MPRLGYIYAKIDSKMQFFQKIRFKIAPYQNMVFLALKYPNFTKIE